MQHLYVTLWGKNLNLLQPFPIQQNSGGTVASLTQKFLSQLHVRIEPIENPVGLDYPTANKLACFSLPTTRRMRIFVDSDLLCLKPFNPDELHGGCLNAKPADLATWGTEEQWKIAYQAVGESFPAHALVRATVSGELMRPYFNAGFIAVDSVLDFGQAWIQSARAIEKQTEITNKRPWLDQIALPIAAVRLGVGFHCLTEHFNFPAHLKPLDPGSLPAFCHIISRKC